MKIFNIAHLISQDLMSRPLADDFYVLISHSGEKKIIVDFQDVHFATRSFIDEFYVLYMKYSSEGYEISLKNVPYDIQKIFDAVKSTQNQKKMISDDTVVKTKDIQDFERHMEVLAI